MLRPLASASLGNKPKELLHILRPPCMRLPTPSYSAPPRRRGARGLLQSTAPRLPAQGYARRLGTLCLYLTPPRGLLQSTGGERYDDKGKGRMQVATNANGNGKCKCDIRL